MVDTARYFGEQVSGVRIAEGCRLRACLTHRLSECRKRSSNSKYMLMLAGDTERIGNKKGSLGRNLHSTVSCAAEPAGPLGNEVGVILRLHGNLVEQLVNRNEPEPAHIPMGLFQLCVQINRRRQVFVQKLDGLRPDILGQGIACGLHGWISRSCRRQQAMSA